MDTTHPESKGQEFAYYPLTLFDGMSGSVVVVTGWLVEGLLDVGKIEEALKRLVSKWPMLSGRLESTGKKYEFRIKIPLEPLPSDYHNFHLTSNVSDVPLSSYVKLPLAPVSDVLPSSLFMDSATPHDSKAWITESLPLTCWHVTHFKESGREYTCIGVSFSHCLLDGMGIAAVVHALEAETLGREWTVPPTPKAGTNVNQLQTFLDETQNKMKSQSLSDYRAVSAVGISYLLYILVWYFWQQVWHKARSQMVLIPPKVYEKLVQDAREAMSREGELGVRLSTGDVLTAWLWKTIYSDGTNPQAKINLSNMASLRMFSDAALGEYAHNCFIPIPYPIFTVAELKATPLHSIAHTLAKTRASLSLAHPMHVYKLLQDVVKPSKALVNIVLPYDTTADENLAMSNMSIARIVDINWRGVGGGRTVCRYKSLLNKSPLLFSNIVTIAGRRDDGCVVLDTILNASRRKRLEEELAKLTKAAELKY